MSEENVTPAQTTAIEEKYGLKSSNQMNFLTSSRLCEKVATRDSVDQHYTNTWLTFAASMQRHTKLDQRSRFLIYIGQYTVTKSTSQLEDTIRAALASGVRAREALEVILQCSVYMGEVVVEPALQIFLKIAEEFGLLEELKDDQLPIDGRDRDRDISLEKPLWNERDRDDPRLPGLTERHGALALSAGLCLRPIRILDALALLDVLDAEFAGEWIRFVYQRMYSRGVLDSKTRALCIVGNLAAMGEASQLKVHISRAFKEGVSPREIMEIIFASSVDFGMPSMFRSLEAFLEVVKENGRSSEIGDPPDCPFGYEPKSG